LACVADSTWLHIFEHADTKQILFGLSRVCKRWQRLLSGGQVACAHFNLGFTLRGKGLMQRST